jgi:carboxyl-terminal processing protease
MPRVILVFLLLLAACAAPATTPTTPSAAPSTVTSPVNTDPAGSTTIADLEVVTTGCSAPPVTFSVLCEVVDLIDRHHLAPPDHASLAAAATSGVPIFSSPEPAARPESLTCAMPSPDFESLCDAIADRLIEDPVELGPLIEVVVEQMLQQVLDPYSTYVPPELSGSLSENGVISSAGVVVEARDAAGSACVLISETCPLVVEVVIAGGAGEAAGLLAGDEVVSVGSHEVSDRTVSEVAAELAGAGEEGIAMVVLREGLEVDLTLKPPAQAVSPVTAQAVGSTGYLRLAEFGFETHLIFHYSLLGLIEGGANRLILDLRDNPGGFLFSVSLIGSEFISEGLLYRTTSPHESLDYPAVEGGIATRIPVIVLVNGSSASSAEILAAALQERGRARVAGTPTFGKNLVQESFELRNRGILRLTTAEWTTPGGASVAEGGLQPDVGLELANDLAIEDLVATVIAAAG